jgi:manganese/zinc/iron transport system permease protein
MDSFWILLVGGLVAVNGALLGTFLLLRRMSMVGDAISHAVLPGIVLAYLVSGSRDAYIMLLGAAALGVFTTVAIEWLHRSGKLPTDASIGLSFTSLFAIGVILLSAYAGSVDLDQDCVLYGEIAYVPLDLLFTPSGQSLGPRALWQLVPVLGLILGCILLFYKELKITTFDPGFAQTLGIPTARYHYLLMILTSLSTVAAFEAVGAILVVAFLVGPAATALLLTRRLGPMLAVACLAALISAGGGYGLAYSLGGSIAGAMAVATGLLFAATLLLSPSRGLLVKRRA